MSKVGSQEAQRWLREFGDRLRELRLSAGLSQEQLAFRAEIRTSYVSDVERGRRNVSLVNIRALAAALDCPAGDFFR
jgi:transcriptional regulator with XRE-family HTH domain